MRAEASRKLRGSFARKLNFDNDEHQILTVAEASRKLAEVFSRKLQFYVFSSGTRKQDWFWGARIVLR